MQSGGSTLNNSHDNTGFSRRRFLKILGGAVVGTGIAASPIFGAMLNRGNKVLAAEQQAHSLEIRHWTMVFDLRRCDGCQGIGEAPRCTQACIEGRFLPEPHEWIEVFEFDLPGGGTRFLPAPCMMCQNAPCVNVCPVAATWITPEGIVLIDQGRCIGCRLCMAACPYDRRFFNWGEPPVPPESHYLEYSAIHQIPARKGTVMKCDFCTELARAGRVPFCITACPNHAIYFGDLEEDLATNGKDLVKLSTFAERSDAFHLKEELGTKPRVLYIPGHGQDVGRDPERRGRLKNTWPWKTTVKGAAKWER